MGETRVSFKIHGADGKAIELHAIVDTGATFTKIPSSIALELGLESKYEAEVELGDGRVIKRGLAPAEVEIEGVRRPMLVTLGREGEKPVIGYTTLEILGFKINPITGKLERTVAIEYLEGSSLCELNKPR
jgi:clan AA aspartic protease